MSSLKCKICKEDVDGAHKCLKCNEYVHVICGKGVGEEGYGQSIICHNCSEKNSDKKVECNIDLDIDSNFGDIDEKQVASSHSDSDNEVEEVNYTD